VDFASDVCSLSAATVVRGSPSWSSAVSAARDRRIRELEPAAREHYAERWGAPQPNFVDQPAHAVAEADALVSEVVRERAYPVAKDFESSDRRRVVNHPVVAEHYRAAHGISTLPHAGRRPGRRICVRRWSISARSSTSSRVARIACRSATPAPRGRRDGPSYAPCCPCLLGVEVASSGRIRDAVVDPLGELTQDPRRLMPVAARRSARTSGSSTSSEIGVLQSSDSGP
jgi:hypothetical protein